jgi:hypothetical protein
MAVAPRIELEIEELVLHGFAPGDRHRIGDALRAELASLLRERAPGAGVARSVERLDAGIVRMASAGPEQAGRGIARAVHGLLT